MMSRAADYAWQEDRATFLPIGRYKSFLVTEPRPLLGLIDYIHLNPVRAGLCTVQTLKSHSLSSYPKYWRQIRPFGFAAVLWDNRRQVEDAGAA